MDEIGKGRIAAMRECAMANYDIASEHVTQIEQMRFAATNLIEGAQHQRQIAVMKQEIIEQERRSNLYTSIGYWVVILGLAVAL